MKKKEVNDIQAEWLKIADDCANNLFKAIESGDKDAAELLKKLSEIKEK